MDLKGITGDIMIKSCTRSNVTVIDAMLVTSESTPLTVYEDGQRESSTFGALLCHFWIRHTQLLPHCASKRSVATEVKVEII